MADDTSTDGNGEHPLLGDLDLGAPVKPAYVVLARKYRPQTFDDLIGQDAMVRTLSNAFAADRIAQGYMLTGVRGIGKTTTARILARALNYSRPGSPDRPSIDLKKPGIHCAEIIDSRHPDVIEMDAASNTGIENIREIIESARYKPVAARYKVFIIDEVHMLSKGAFNALLKTLEEPPSHVKFIFATTEIRKVPVTVLSRCQRFDLRRVDVPMLSRHLAGIVAKEGAAAEDEALLLIARSAGGSVRDGLSLLDQAIATAAGSAGAGLPTVRSVDVRMQLGLADRGRLFDLLEHIVAGRTGVALEALAALRGDGADPVQVLEDLAEAVHATSCLKVAGEAAGSEALSAEEKRRAASLAGKVSVPVLSRVWSMLLKGIDEAGRAPNASAAADMVVIRIAQSADLPSPEEIARLLGGGTVSRRAGARSDAPPAVSERDGRTPLNEVEPPPPASLDDYGAADTVPPEEDADLSDGTESPAEFTPVFADPRSFVEVVDLVGQKRDARLKVHLEEHVGLVRFDPAGSIEINLLPGAPPEIANELREKLNKWTGRRWMVAVSRARGEMPLGAQTRAREAAEIEALKKHPAVASLLEAFPDAKIESVKPVKARIEDEDQATG